MKFIDLFAGIGGFHLALSRFPDAQCVFASEIDEFAAEVYSRNFGIKVHGDISLDSVKNAIPEKFDLLCAGFPCQPFSKGGQLKGFEDTRGTLFFDIITILHKHRPQYVLLENVANLVGHDDGNTYRRILESLKSLGYSVPDVPIILSPHQFGIPVLRQRVFIPCRLGSPNLFKTRLNFKPVEGIDACDYFGFCNSDENVISKVEHDILKIWDEFYHGIDLRVIGFPIWLSELNEKVVPYSDPQWKQSIKRKNRDLYKRNKAFVDRWLLKHNGLVGYSDSQKKFEWQCGADCQSVFDGFIQFRPSGIRVKRPNYFSTQVAINHPQIIGKYLRRLSVSEAKKLQSIPDDFVMHNNGKIALKQLGNSVNVDVVYNVLKSMGI
jgi:DNA (cytosine-5)-methyltransferase 1